jgi:hypothetical protein
VQSTFIASARFSGVTTAGSEKTRSAWIATETVSHVSQLATATAAFVWSTVEPATRWMSSRTRYDDR